MPIDSFFLSLAEEQKDRRSACLNVGNRLGARHVWPRKAIEAEMGDT